MSASRPRRVLLWSPLPPPTGGIATWTRGLLDSNLAERYEIRVIDNNVSGLPAGARLRKALRLSAAFCRFVVALASWKPHIAHVCSSSWWPGYLKEAALVALARVFRARTVLHFHSKGPHFLDQYRSFRAIGRRTLRWPDAILVLFVEALDYSRAMGLGQTRQIPNFVVGRKATARKAPSRSRNLRLLYVGWIIREKGVLDLLDALTGIPRVELELLGRFVVDRHGGTLEAEIRDRLAGNPDLARRVDLRGEVPMNEVWQHYERADLFVLPSWSEGFPNTLVESMMAGLPALVTCVGAMPEMVVHGRTGVVVPPRDADALARALRELTDAPDRFAAMGLAARQRAMALYEREIVVERLAALYDELDPTAAHPLT